MLTRAVREMNETLHRCAGVLWLQGHTARASLLCSVGKIFHCVHYLSAVPHMFLNSVLSTEMNHDSLVILPIA